jgi:acyl carrier protein
LNVTLIQQKVVEFLITATGQSSIDGVSELQESGIIDSLLMMDLLVYIETQFGVRLDFEDLTPDAFQTPTTIARLIESRIGNSQK